MRTALLGLVGAVLAGRTAWAQPAVDVPVSQAKQLYLAAEQEIASGAYADAARDYGAAYELTKDPVLFFKIGTANEKAGQCDVAVVYFRRYLNEAAPEAKFVALTEERLAACGAKPAVPVEPAPVPPPAPVAQPEPEPAPVVPAPLPAAPKSPPPAPHGDRHAAAWLVAGGGVALVITGVVLAEAAKSSEQDVSDLYVGLQNVPPTYDATTAKRYQQLLDEGHRYEYLSWTAFGLTAAAAGVSAYLFTRGRDESVVAPMASPHGAGVSATWAF